MKNVFKQIQKDNDTQRHLVVKIKCGSNRNAVSTYTTLMVDKYQLFISFSETALEYLAGKRNI